MQIVRGYKLLLRDFAINIGKYFDDEIYTLYSVYYQFTKLLLYFCIFVFSKGIVSREADLFADEIFHYEKRIVTHIDSVKQSDESKLNEIKTLAEMKTIAPSVCLLEMHNILTLLCKVYFFLYFFLHFSCQ